jgi:hypothetical protein
VITTPAARPFQLDAILACERDGHPDFAWVPTWGDLGYEECTRCGESRWHGRLQDRDAVFRAGLYHRRAGWSEWLVPLVELVAQQVVETDDAACGHKPRQAVGCFLERDPARGDSAQDQYQGLGVAHAAQHTATLRAMRERSTDPAFAHGPDGMWIDGVERIHDKDGRGYIERGPGNRIAIWTGPAHGVSVPAARRGPGGSRPRNPDRDAAIIAALGEGQRPTDIAAKWGVSPSRISQIAKKARRST